MDRNPPPRSDLNLREMSALDFFTIDRLLQCRTTEHPSVAKRIRNRLITELSKTTTLGSFIDNDFGRLFGLGSVSNSLMARTLQASGLHAVSKESMTRINELLAKKAAELEECLQPWVEAEGILRPGQRLVVSLHIKPMCLLLS